MVLDGTDRKVTEPLGGAVRFILTLAGVLLAILLIFAIFWQIALFGLGSGPACSDVRLNGMTISGGSPTVAHLLPGATSIPSVVKLCAPHPTIGQRILVSLTQVPTIALYLAVVLLVAQLLRVIRSA